MGLGSLKASDEEVDKGKTVAPVAAAGDSGDNSGEYEIENAKSSRSVCKSCNEKIEKGHVRNYKHCNLCLTLVALVDCSNLR